MSEACGIIVRSIIQAANELAGNTTATNHGTVVSLFCQPGYVLNGDKIVRCRDGQWIPEPPKCVVAPTTENTPFNQTDIIIISSCASAVFILLVALIAVLCVYFRKKKSLRKEDDSFTKSIVSPGRTTPVSRDTQYGVSYPYSMVHGMIPRPFPVDYGDPYYVEKDVRSPPRNQIPRPHVRPLPYAYTPNSRSSWNSHNGSAASFL